MAGFRLERVAELIKEVTSDIIRELKDPRVGFASITQVKVSPDLGHAKIYVSILGDEKSKKETIEGLTNAKGFIRRELSKQISLRHIPEIAFVADDSIEEGVRVLNLINKVTAQDAQSKQGHHDE
ncbi:MAG: 30S ribosome-binding factor RbfA [Candidatus Eremiobacteraeota bacterium]|nr:30S ribosome-binding factor RbfA [Candidatus Eremiobacteraeota bacterium]